MASSSQARSSVPTMWTLSNVALSASKAQTPTWPDLRDESLASRTSLLTWPRSWPPVKLSIMAPRFDAAKGEGLTGHFPLANSLAGNFPAMYLARWLRHTGGALSFQRPHSS